MASVPGLITDKRHRYEKQRAKLQQDRTSFDQHWQEISEFLLPRRTRFFASGRNRGDRRNQKIIDSTSRFASRTLSSGLHAGLTSPARPWLKLTTPDPQLAAFAPVKEWLHLVTERMLTVFQQTNLYNVLPTVYSDMGTFGTGAMAILDDAADLFRAYAYALGSYWVGLDARGNATTFVRDYELTVRQVVEQFGVVEGRRDIDWSRLSLHVRNQWDLGEYEAPVGVTWIVTPNVEYREGAIEARFFKWASCYFETGSNEKGRRQFLRESGFRTFPLMVPRWDVEDGDSYGTDCPGMTALGDVKGLQIQQRRKAQGIEKGINPPMTGPSALRSQKTSLLPGDITYIDVREGMQGLRAAHEISMNLDHMRQDIREVQYRIQRAFYEDLFLMLATSDQSKEMTAREVQERHQEKLLALGPVLERTNDELLDPLIDRVFDMLLRDELVPPPPPEVLGVDLKVEYISIMAQAQKLVGVVGQDRFLQSTIPLLEAFPEVRHKVNIFQVVDNYADMLGVDPRLVRPSDEAQALLDAEREAQQAAQQAEQAQMLARATKDAAQAPMEGDTALSRVLGGAVAGNVP